MIEFKSSVMLKADMLEVISKLTTTLSSVKDGCSDENYKILHRAIGELVGDIQMKILEPIYKYYPELDDLAD